MRKLITIVLVILVIIYLQLIQNDFTQAQDFTQPIPTAQITIQPANWFNEFFTYPNSTSVNTGFNPLYVHEVSQNAAFVQYMLKTSDSQDTVIQWYTDHASDYGFIATTDPVGPMTTSMLSKQGLDPALIKSVIVYHAVKPYICTGFIVGAYPVTVSPGNIILATPVSSPSVLKEFSCTLSQTAPTISPTPTIKISPTSKQLLPTPTPEMKCSINKIDQEQIDQFKKQIQIDFNITIDEQNALCGVDQCSWQYPLSENDLKQMQELFNKLPTEFTLKLSGMSVRGPDVNAFMNYEKRLCCKPNDMFGAYIPFDNTVVICGANGMNRCPSPGHQCITKATIIQVLSHEMIHYWQNNFISNIPSNIPFRAYLNPIVIEWVNSTGWLPLNSNPSIPHCFPVIGCVGLSTPTDIPAGYNPLELDPYEDMANSIQIYINNPSDLRTTSPRRYEFIKTLIMDGKEF